MKGKLGKKIRRLSALKLLQQQLASGQKPAKVNGKEVHDRFVLLTDIEKKQKAQQIEKLTKLTV